MDRIIEKHIKASTRLESAQGDILVIAVNTDGKKKKAKEQKKWTAYMAPVAKALTIDKPTPHQKSQVAKAHHYTCIAVATRGRILEKSEAIFYFPKLKQADYQKKDLS